MKNNDLCRVPLKASISGILSFIVETCSGRKNNKKPTQRSTCQKKGQYCRSGRHIDHRAGRLPVPRSPQGPAMLASSNRTPD